MENLFLFLATSLVLRIPHPKFKRYFIGNTGCSSLLLAGGNGLHVKYTADGDKIFFNDHESDGVGFGLITVEMKEPHTMKKAAVILGQYMNQVREPLKIAYAVAKVMETLESGIAITDYWQDRQGIDWKVKGYTNGKMLTVLYVKNISKASVAEHDAFLNSFRFS